MTDFKTPLKVVIIGAGGIGSAIAKLILQRFPNAYCIVTYHDRVPNLRDQRIILLKLDATSESQFIDKYGIIKDSLGKAHWIINTVGVLHNALLNIQPEKKIADFEESSFKHLIDVNVLPTLYAAKHWLGLIDRHDFGVFCTVSAKVGSIADNSLGGWYSYRASKACLNMMLKNLAIEFKHKKPKLCVLSLHPGTTDSNLSSPFQKNVAPEKLFSPERTATQLVSIISSALPKDSGSFLNWDGTVLAW